MIFLTLVVGPLEVNCYIIGCEATREAVLIDPGGDADRIIAKISQKGLKVRSIINTHGHFDHVGGNRSVAEKLGAPILIHEEDVLLLNRAADVAKMYGFRGDNSPAPEQYLTDGMELPFGECCIRVIHTPGHTQGGCCLYLKDEKKVITGDTLFADSIGRTDLPGGSHEQLIESIRSRLFTLPDDVTVFPGHGPETTISHEKRNNPYFD